MARSIYAVAWSWRRHKIVPTKKRGTEKMRAWKKWHERQGWTVRSYADGYLALAPDYQPEDWPRSGPDAKVRVIGLEEYDPVTKERIVRTRTRAA